MAARTMVWISTQRGSTTVRHKLTNLKKKKKFDAELIISTVAFSHPFVTTYSPFFSLFIFLNSMSTDSSLRLGAINKLIETLVKLYNSKKSFLAKILGNNFWWSTRKYFPQSRNGGGGLAPESAGIAASERTTIVSRVASGEKQWGVYKPARETQGAQCEVNRGFAIASFCAIATRASFELFSAACEIQKRILRVLRYRGFFF